MAFGGVPRKPGEVHLQYVPIGEFADGTPVKLPVATITGKQDGPTVYVQGGIHGDEATGIEIARRVINGIRPEELNGCLVVVPVANVPAYLTRTRGYLMEERWLIDINRVFPGSKGGLLSERIANLIVNEFVLPADFTLDLHAALEGCDIVPFTYVSPDDNEKGTLEVRRRAAHAFGTHYVYYHARGKSLGTSDFSRSLSNQAEEAGKPMGMAEMGESRRVKHEVVPLGVAGVRRVLQALRALPGEPEPTKQQRIFRNIVLLHANRGGGLRLSVDLGEEVERGQRVGELVDVFGRTVEELLAPASGFAMRVMRLASVSTGAEVLWIGH